MSDTHGDDTANEEQTDPSVALPSERPSAIGAPRFGGEAGRPSTLPPRRSTLPPLPARPSSLPPARPPLPSSPRPASMRPPPIRSGSLPPASMPKPTDPPRSEGSFIDRQRIAQLETLLDRANKTLAEQRDAIDELRARIVTSAAQLEDRIARANESARSEAALRVDAIEQRVAAIEAQRAAPPDEDDEEDRGDPLARIEERLRVLEEGTGEARIRMRLERAGHRIEELDRRLASVEEIRRASSAAIERIEAESAAREARLARIESLFEELAEELRQEREAIDLDGVRARLDDLETLVLQAGTEEEALRKKLAEQESALANLRESMVPPSVQGDDLTRIKGIGPKYARMLGDMGITTFAQIAAWSDEDVEEVAGKLGIAAARITKAGWVEAAAELAG